MAKTKKPQWFKLYAANKALFDAVDDEILGRGLRFAMEYFTDGVIPSYADPLTLAVFNTIKAAADEAIAEYQARVNDGRNGGATRWNKDA